jgi:glycosyltransferase involved in cell wall biosynthesis
MTNSFVVTVVTLCRNNPLQLRHTLTALPDAVIGLAMPWQLLVVDGSDGSDCAEIAAVTARELGLPLFYKHRQPRGIYAAMNDALELADGTLVGFMHAGDRYLPGGLSALVWHWLELAENQKNQMEHPADAPVAVFGQAWVQPTAGYRAWLTPDPAMRRLRLWLKGMVPCHQAFVFERGFACAHPYGSGSLVADRAVMRAALARSGPGAYLRQPVCVYDLSGVSSALPAGRELVRRLRDPQRLWFERAAELAKALLRSTLATSYPRLMRWRARAWGWCCR